MADVRSLGDVDAEGHIGWPGFIDDWKSEDWQVVSPWHESKSGSVNYSLKTSHMTRINSWNGEDDLSLQRSHDFVHL